MLPAAPPAILVAVVAVPEKAPLKVVAVTVPLTCRAVEGAVFPIPTLPLVRMVNPLAAVVELDWNRARVPAVPELLLMTFNRPVVVFIEALVVEILNPVPEESELATRV